MTTKGILKTRHGIPTYNSYYRLNTKPVMRKLTLWRKNRLSSHEPMTTLLEHGKNLGKSEKLGFIDPLYARSPNSKPHQLYIEHVAPNTFAKDGFGTIVRNPCLNMQIILYKSQNLMVIFSLVSLSLFWILFV